MNSAEELTFSRRRDRNVEAARGIAARSRVCLSEVWHDNEALKDARISTFSFSVYPPSSSLPLLSPPRLYCPARQTPIVYLIYTRYSLVRALRWIRYIVFMAILCLPLQDAAIQLYWLSVYLRANFRIYRTFSRVQERMKIKKSRDDEFM